MIICEAGQNHCGSMDLAKKLIHLARENGGDLVKFQLYNHKSLYGDNPAIPNVELSFEQAKMLFEYGREIGMEVFFSVSDVERVKWCEEIGVKRYKVACKMRDESVLEAIALTNKPVIMSMNDEFAGGYHCGSTKARVDYLYCVPKYPAEIDDLDFNGRNDSWDSTNTFDLVAGFSDHTIGLDAAKIALSRGAEIIEKHFAIDHETGVDAPWSMTPEELKELVRFSKIVEEVL